MSSPPSSHLPPLIRSLQDPSLYAHPVAGIHIIETHISWIVLTGRIVYKIKKPVNLGFVDFSSLEKRCFFCHEELRLNRRLASRLYLDVIAISGDPLHPVFDGPGEPIEYAVKMTQFDPDEQLDRLIARQALDGPLIDDLAERLARFHEAAGRDDSSSPYGDAAAVHRPVIENFEQIASLPFAQAEQPRLARLRTWSEETHRRLAPVLEQRKRQGCIRECHGDLHLANIARIDGRAIPFDCLEFNAALRWIDTVSEIAFLCMDLDFHGHDGLTLRFLNVYLHHHGDYEGLRCLRYYLVYRAMVRAKVACLRAGQDEDDEVLRAQRTEYLEHLTLAERYTTPPPTALILTHGLSGCGKTTLTGDLLAPCRAIRIRSDVERKRLSGLAPDARSTAAINTGLYSRAAGERTYRRLADLAAVIVEAGYTALVDATFLKREQRDDFKRLASRLRVPLVILDIQAPETLLRERLKARSAAGRDASEADIAVLEHQIASREPLAEDERAEVVTIHTDAPVDSGSLAAEIRRRIALRTS